MTGHYVLCLIAALATFARLAGTARPVVRCESCDTGALLMCKPLPKDCVERVREPACGCCMTCALGEGQACGVYTARCGSGLTCQQQPGESRPLQALLDGRGMCSGAASKKLSNIVLPRPGKWWILPAFEGIWWLSTVHEELLRCPLLSSPGRFSWMSDRCDLFQMLN